MQNEWLTVQQFSNAAGISKQAVYKALNNKLKNYVKLVDGQKMICSKALSEVYKKAVEQRNNQPLNNIAQPQFEQIIAMLQAELTVKNEQIAAQNRQIEQLTTALQSTTESLQAAQMLHAGTMQKQIESASDEPASDTITEQEKKRFWHRWFR